MPKPSTPNRRLASSVATLRPIYVCLCCACRFVGDNATARSIGSKVTPERVGLVKFPAHAWHRCENVATILPLGFGRGELAGAVTYGIKNLQPHEVACSFSEAWVGLPPNVVTALRDQDALQKAKPAILRGLKAMPDLKRGQPEGPRTIHLDDPRIVKIETWKRQTRHTVKCRRDGERYDSKCPRCQELIAGAKPRK